MRCVSNRITGTSSFRWIAARGVRIWSGATMAFSPVIYSALRRYLARPLSGSHPGTEIGCKLGSNQKESCCMVTSKAGAIRPNLQHRNGAKLAYGNPIGGKTLRSPLGAPESAPAKGRQIFCLPILPSSSAIPFRVSDNWPNFALDWSRGEPELAPPDLCNPFPYNTLHTSPASTSRMPGEQIRPSTSGHGRKRHPRHPCTV